MRLIGTLIYLVPGAAILFVLAFAIADVDLTAVRSEIMKKGLQRDHWNALGFLGLGTALVARSMWVFFRH